MRLGDARAKAEPGATEPITRLGGDNKGEPPHPTDLGLHW